MKRTFKLSAMMFMLVLAISFLCIQPVYADHNPAAPGGTVHSIQITTPPDCTDYALYDLLDLQGILLTVQYEEALVNNDTFDADGITSAAGFTVSYTDGLDLNSVSGFESTDTLTREVVITYGAKEVSYTIDVKKYAFEPGTKIVINPAAENTAIGGGNYELRWEGGASVYHSIVNDNTAAIGADGKLDSTVNPNSIYELMHNLGSSTAFYGYGIIVTEDGRVLRTDLGGNYSIWSDYDNYPNVVFNNYLWRIIRINNGNYALVYTGDNSQPAKALSANSAGRVSMATFDPEDTRQWFTVLAEHDVPAAVLSIDNIEYTDLVQYSGLTAGAVTYDVAGNPVSDMQYQWLRGDTETGSFTPITGAVNATYALKADDIGKWIKVTATGSASGLTTGTATSAAVGPIVQYTGQMTSSADIESIRLIEDGWIEICWKNRMAYALGSNETLSTRDNYMVLLNGNPVQISSAKHYELGSTYMTSLQIRNWGSYFNFDDETEASGLPWLNDGLFTYNAVGHYYEYTGAPVDINLTLQLKSGVDFNYSTGSSTADTDIVYDVLYEPFYKHTTEIFGITVRTSDKANPDNFIKCETIIQHMLKKSIDESLGIQESIADWGMQIVISGAGENLWILPEYRDMQTFGANPAGGYGAGPTEKPTMGLAGGSNVVGTATVVHEFGHCVQMLALAIMPEYRQFMSDYGDMYLEVVDQGMYLGDGTGDNNQFGSSFSYALTNSGEFFAEATSMWFNSYGQNNSRPTSRQAMQVYNPKLYNLLKLIYTEEDLPNGLSSPSPSTYSTPFTYSFVDNRSAGDNGEIGYAFDGNYFSLLSFLNTHVVDDESNVGAQLATWWNYSHTPYNYNFDGLSWVVTPVVKDGKTYYNFTMKGNNPLNPGQGSGTDDRFGDGTGIPGCFYDSDGKGGLSIGVQGTDSSGQPIVAMVLRDLDDDTQLWSLESWMGRYSQIVNKSYDMSLSTDGGIIPTDGTKLVLVPFALKPDMGALWRVIQLKPVPEGGTATSLLDDKYAVIPTARDIKMQEIWIDNDGYINIIWSDNVESLIAGDAANYSVLLGTTVIALDPAESKSAGNHTKLKLQNPPTQALLDGLGASIKFTGNMTGTTDGLPVNNETAYAFRYVNKTQALPVEYIITATAGAGGAISPDGAVYVPEGDSRSFAITPDSEYEILEIKVDGAVIGNTSTYVFDNVTADHTITVTFKHNPGGSGSGRAPGTAGGGTTGGTDIKEEPIPLDPETDTPVVVFDDDWKDVIDAIDALDKGGELIVKVPDDVAVPKDVLESIKDKDAEVTFETDSNISWTVKGENLPDDITADLPLGVTSNQSDEHVIDGSAVEIHVRPDYEGDFGFDLTLNIYLNEDSAGEKVCIYYRNEDGELVLHTETYIDDKGVVSFDIDYGREYILAVFIAETAPYEPIFTDVSQNDWFYDSVLYAYEHGLMEGVTDTVFAPGDPVSREVVVSILWHLAGEPEAAGEPSFTDLGQSRYANAIAWAAENGIVLGYDNEHFGPGDGMTREQLITTLYRYFITTDAAVTEGSELEKFLDAGKIHDWALDAMKWAVAEGLVIGRAEDALAPEGIATRAELATVLRRYAERFL